MLQGKVWAGSFYGSVLEQKLRYSVSTRVQLCSETRWETHVHGASEHTPTQAAAEPGKGEATALSKSDLSPPFNSAPRWSFGGVALVPPPSSSLSEAPQVCVAQPG